MSRLFIQFLHPRGEPDRLQKVADHFGMNKHLDCFGRWTYLRNNLIHEVNWLTESPGFRMLHLKSNLEVLYIQNITSKVIAGVVGHITTFLSGLWKTNNETGFS